MPRSLPAGVLARIEAPVSPAFIAGIVIDNGRVVRAAPIVAYMHGWTPARVKNYCDTRGWSIARVPTVPMNDEIKALADEAEAGYDVDALIARRAANEHDTTATPSTMQTEGPSDHESATTGDTNTTDQPPDTENH